MHLKLMNKIKKKGLYFLYIQITKDVINVGLDNI